MVLASGSPRRRRILQDAGLDFTIQISNAEPEPHPGVAASAFAVEAAGVKARDVAGRCPGRIVVGADTVVALDNTILGKPADLSEAAGMLRGLSGRKHQVITGVVIAFNDADGVRVVWTGCESSDVIFKELLDEDIARYVETGEPMGKAGAYAIQGRGGELVKRVDGSYLNVVGLPLDLLKRSLDDLGYRGPGVSE
ncbi:MAG: Maf family protein [Armatimonadota bacterium]